LPASKLSAIAVPELTLPLITGKSNEEVVPATITFPDESVATELIAVVPMLPPRVREKIRAESPAAADCANTIAKTPPRKALMPLPGSRRDASAIERTEPL
jgi:hypothetical protein